MVGRKNVRISPWWAAMLPTLRTTALDHPHCLCDIGDTDVVPPQCQV